MCGYICADIFSYVFPGNIHKISQSQIYLDPYIYILNIYIYMYMCVCLGVYLKLRRYIYIYIYMCVCVCVCVCVHKYVQIYLVVSFLAIFI